MENDIISIPALGQEAPEFTAMTTQGKINFPRDYEGQWVIFFSHPADFTPVCTSEISTFAAMQDEFEKMGVQLVGLSVDSNSSHLAWIKEIQEKINFGNYSGQPIRFPIVADIQGEIARQYGMIHQNMSDTKTVRAVFIIDPQSKIRTILYYPQSTGRNFAEIKRIVKALQTTDEYDVSTPADWQTGDDVLLAAPCDTEELQLRLEECSQSDKCQDWFFCQRSYDDLKKK